MQLAARAELGSRAAGARRRRSVGAVGRLEAALASGNLSPADAGRRAGSAGARVRAPRPLRRRGRAVLEAALHEAEAIDDEPAVLRFSVLLANTLIDQRQLRRRRGGARAAFSAGRGASSDPVTLSQLYWSQSRLHSSQGRSDLAAHYARLAHASLAGDRAHACSPPARSCCSRTSRTTAATRAPRSSSSTSAHPQDRRGGQPARGGDARPRAGARAVDARRERGGREHRARRDREVQRRPPDQRRARLRVAAGIFRDLGDRRRRSSCTSSPSRPCPSRTGIWSTSTARSPRSTRSGAPSPSRSATSSSPSRRRSVPVQRSRAEA